MEEGEPTERTQARRALYRFLSTAFYPPRSDSREVWAGLKLAAGADDEKSGTSIQLDGDGLEIEYNRLFVGPARVPCPPYESVHVKDRPEMELGLVLGPSAADVKRKYSEAGLVVSESFRDLPDHIGVELEFMWFLCDRELNSKDDGDAEKWRRLERDFLASHLEPWAGQFAAKVLGSTSSPYYRLAATVLQGFLTDEAEYLGTARRGQP